MPRNLIWGCDLLTKTDQQGTSYLALAIVDHASRACLRLQGLTDKSSMKLLQALVQAVMQYGRPRFVRTDNEAVCTSAWFTWGGADARHPSPTDGAGLPLAEWTGGTVHWYGQTSIGRRADRGQGRMH